MKHKARKQCCQIQTGNAAGERKPQIVRERGIKMNFKKAFTLFAAGIMTAGMIAGTGVPAMAAEKIGEAAAEEIALDDAGLTRNDVTFDRTEAGTEHGAAVYEIEFRTSSKEYDYDISMADGEIVSRGYDLRNPSASGSQISEEEAKQIALKDAGVSESDADFTKIENGTEDGIPVFEIEFEDAEREFDYDVAKAGGKILNYSETVKTPACVAAAQKKEAAASATGKTGRDAAIDAALDHAGFSRDEVSALKCERGHEDGREVYEV